MALSKTLEKAFNDQIKHEFYSAYLYLSMAAYCASLNLQGFAHWMRLQAREEVSHALRIYDFLDDRSARITLEAIPQPPTDFTSPLELAKQVQAHEAMVTGKINDLYALASKEQDYAGQTFLHWFINEQVEEEKSSTQLVERLELAGDNKSALFILDKELGARAGEG